MMRRCAFWLAAFLLACGSAQTRVGAGDERSPGAAATAAPAAPAGDENSEPPPAGLSPDAPFPTIARRELPNGFGLRIVERRSLPLVELRLVVPSGHATDGAKTGLAALTGQLLKAGGAGRWSPRQLVEQIERLGAGLEVTTDRDATRISIAVTSTDLEPALQILAALVQEPRFDATEFGKLRQREIERLLDLSRTSATFMAKVVLYRELYELPSAVHPYSRYGATPAELKQISLEDCRAWYRAQFSPKNAFLVIAGDVSAEAAETPIRRAFEAWKGEPKARAEFEAPRAPNRARVFVVDRPASTQSQIYLATLGPELHAPSFPAFEVMNNVLGHGRLFLEIREKRALSYSVESEIVEVSRGPVPIVLGAATNTRKTAHAVAALLEQVTALASGAPPEDEVSAAGRQLADGFVVTSATAGALADLTARLGVLQLPDDWYDDYRSALKAVEPAQVRELAGRYLNRDRMLIAVAGAAGAIAEPLRRFGPVTIVDAEQGFSTRRTLTHDPSVALDAVAPRP
jgi:predicted Zn-dependent peptidase